MSKYTTEVRFICETAAGLTESKGANSVDEIVQKAIPEVFNFSFPIYDETYRNVLCVKILKHYYTREICAETVGLWKLWLNTRLNEIMPYYNQLYKSATLEFNPLYDIDLTTTHQGKNDGKTVSNGESNESSSGNNSQESHQNVDNTNWNLFSDTPQGAIDNLQNETYLTNATKNTGNGITNNTSSGQYGDKRKVNRNDNSTVNNTEEYIHVVSGKSGGDSYSKRLIEYRDTFLNIDKMIIDELADLFFNLW